MKSLLAKQLDAYRTAALPEERQRLFKQLLAEIKTSLKQNDYSAAASAIAAVADQQLDFTSAQLLVRLRQKLQGKIDPHKTRCKLAILGSFTMDHLAQLIEFFLFAAGISAEIYQGEYGTFRQEIFDPESGLYLFHPQLLFLATTRRDLAHIPSINFSREQVLEAIEREYADWQQLWRTAHERLSCQIIQNNFESPAWRALDNHEMRHAASPSNFIMRMNLTMADRAPAYVTLHDVEHLAAATGHEIWADQRFFHLAKIPCAPECQVDYAHSVASLISAQLGKAKKCLVLDLDNTLWGGIIGDDGVSGIRIGQGNPEGEAFLEFQQYALALRRRGVILAVCSKNDQRVAQEAFTKHSEMAIKLEDISCFVANWNDKAANLRHIAEQLNIGLDSMVFVDDNPAERAIVRQLLPEVAVPEIGADPADYIRAIKRHRYFQTLSLANEDLQRTEFYRANAERASLQSSAGDLKQFLQSLNMTGRFEPINPMSLERATQLVNKSNQFNLTTRRYSAAEILARTADPLWVTCTMSLIDQFGDNGLISVLMAQEVGDALAIDTWLMSCRVLKRGVERHLLNHIVAKAQQRGLKRIRGLYIPSPKNGMVAEHYKHLGFEEIHADSGGETEWELDISAGFKPFETFVKELA
jgi:FkbH-like protein